MLQHFVKKIHGFWPVIIFKNSPCMYIRIDTWFNFLNATDSSELFYQSVLLCYSNKQSSSLRKGQDVALSEQHLFHKQLG
jgi:hypothetical protein